MILDTTALSDCHNPVRPDRELGKSDCPVDSCNNLLPQAGLPPTISSKPSVVLMPVPLTLSTVYFVVSRMWQGPKFNVT